MYTIKIFSKLAMVNHIISYSVLPNEYYISILPTGGPKSTPIFKIQSPNIITLIFDDVTENQIKDMWPDGVGTFMAQAMTEFQAVELISFIKKIPHGSTINIHCVEGKSRSVAIGAAIENKPLAGNTLVYKMVRERLYDNT